jgi:hypothetical protein
MPAGEIEQQADDLVFHPAQTLGATAAVAVREQPLLGPGAAFIERDLQALRHCGAQAGFVAAAPGRGEFFQLGAERACVDQLGRSLGRVCGGGACVLVEGESGHRPMLG